MVKNSKEYMKEYYQNNKDKFKPKDKECEICGITIKHGRLWKHKKTLRHQAFEEQLNKKLSEIVKTD